MQTILKVWGILRCSDKRHSFSRLRQDTINQCPDNNENRKHINQTALSIHPKNAKEETIKTILNLNQLNVKGCLLTVAETLLKFQFSMNNQQNEKKTDNYKRLEFEKRKRKMKNIIL
jgi:hypothetical protein